MTLVLSQQAAMQVRNILSRDRFRLMAPRLLADGTYALSEHSLNDPSNTKVLPLLKAAAKRSVSAGEYLDPSYGFLQNAEPYYLSVDRKPWSLKVLVADLHEFGLRGGDQGYSSDPVSVRHRSEIVSVNRPAFGTELWQAYSFMHVEGTTSAFCICNQWHGSDTSVSRSPALQFDIGNNAFNIFSRSDALLNEGGNGTDVLQYSAAALAKSVWHNFVVNVKFASSGFLRVWLNGSQIINYTGPIGYYNDEQGSYQQHGIYAGEKQANLTVRYANMRWGTTDLSGQITSPMPIPT